MADNYRFRFEVKPGRFCYVQTEDQQDSGRAIKADLERRWRPPNWCFHLRSGGHIAALEVHTDNQFFAAIDLANFFGTVNRSKVTRSLKKIGLSYKYASEIAGASTVRSGKETFIPYGFTQSPLLASIAITESHLGRKIEALIRKEIQISLYVDDLIISHRDNIEHLNEALDTLLEAATISGFQINTDKLQKPNTSISAFNIQLSKHNLTLKTERLLDFKEKLSGAEPTPSTLATIGYVEQIDPWQADILRNEVGLAPKAL